MKKLFAEILLFNIYSYVWLMFYLRTRIVLKENDRDTTDSLYDIFMTWFPFITGILYIAKLF